MAKTFQEQMLEAGWERAPELDQKSGLLRRAADIPLALAEGAVDLGESAVGIGSLLSGGKVGQWMQQIGYDPSRTRETIESYMSPETRRGREAIGAAEGAGETLAALAENPYTALTYGVRSLPYMGGSVAAARGAASLAGRAAAGRGLDAAAQAARATSAARTAAGASEGALTAGGIAEDIRRETPEDVAAMYGAAVPAGIGTALIGRLGGGLESALGTRGLVEGAGMAGGMARRALKGGATEAAEEAAQSGQERFWQNLATGRPLDENVAKEATMGGVLGGLIGAPFGAMAGRQGAPAQPAQEGADALEAALAAEGAAQPGAPAAAAPGGPQLAPELTTSLGAAPTADIAGAQGQETLQGGLISSAIRGAVQPGQPVPEVSETSAKVQPNLAEVPPAAPAGPLTRAAAAGAATGAVPAPAPALTEAPPAQYRPSRMSQGAVTRRVLADEEMRRAAAERAGLPPIGVQELQPQIEEITPAPMPGTALAPREALGTEGLVVGEGAPQDYLAALAGPRQALGIEGLTVGEATQRDLIAARTPARERVPAEGMTVREATPQAYLAALRARAAGGGTEEIQAAPPPGELAAQLTGGLPQPAVTEPLLPQPTARAAGAPLPTPVGGPRGGGGTTEQQAVPRAEAPIPQREVTTGAQAVRGDEGQVRGRRAGLRQGPGEGREDLQQQGQGQGAQAGRPGVGQEVGREEAAPEEARTLNQAARQAFEAGVPEDMISGIMDRGTLAGRADEDIIGDLDAAVSEATGEPIFRRGAGAGRVTKEQATQQVADIAARWKGAPQVTVVADRNDPDLPAPIRERMTRENVRAKAAVHGGKVYVLASEVEDQDDLARTLVDHEFRHTGMRQVLGGALKPVLANAMISREAPKIRAFAEANKIDIKTVNGRLEAAEEYLVDLARKEQDTPLLKRVYGAVRDWARRLGFNLRLTDTDMRYLVAAAGRFAKEGRTKGGKGLAKQFAGKPTREAPVRFARRGGWSGDRGKNYAGPPEPPMTAGERKEVSLLLVQNQKDGMRPGEALKAARAEVYARRETKERERLKEARYRLPSGKFNWPLRAGELLARKGLAEGEKAAVTEADKDKAMKALTKEGASEADAAAAINAAISTFSSTKKGMTSGFVRLPAEKLKEALRLRLTRKHKGAPPKNLRTFTDSNGSVYVGLPTLDQWVGKVENVLTAGEVKAAAKWYEDVRKEFERVFGKGEMADMAVIGWLASNQNVTPAVAMRNMLHVRELLNGFATHKTVEPKSGWEITGQLGTEEIKQGGLADSKLRELFRLGHITHKIGPKLTDFIDAAFKEHSRRWTADSAFGDVPFVIDIHSMRDMGYVDKYWSDYLVKRFGRKATMGIKLDSPASKRKIEKEDDEGNVISTKTEYVSTAISDPGYDTAANHGRWLTGELNKAIKAGEVDAKTWGDKPLKAAQVQAIGWVAQLKLMEGKAFDTRGSIDSAKWRASFEVSPGKGAPILTALPQWDNLTYDQQSRVTAEVADFVMQSAQEITGVYAPVKFVGPGGWLGSPSIPSTQATAWATPRGAELLAAAIGVITEQTEVWIHRPAGPASSHNSVFIDVRSADLATGVDLKAFWDVLAPMDPASFQGYAPITNEKGNLNGIRIMFPTEKRQSVDALEANVLKLLDHVKAAAKQQKISVKSMVGRSQLKIIRNNWEKNPDGKGFTDPLVSRYGSGVLGRLVDYYRPQYRDKLEAAISRELGRKEGPSYSRPDGGGKGGVAGVGERRTSPPVREDGTVKLWHWRRTPGYKQIDPNKYGTGLPGAERKRREQDPANWVNRSYYGIASDEPGGYKKEQGLGNHLYFTSVPMARLYDGGKDPERLGPAARAERDEMGGNWVNIMERMMRDRGYAGYWINDQSMGMVGAVFEPLAVEDYRHDVAFSRGKQGKYGDPMNPVRMERKAQLERGLFGREMPAKWNRQVTGGAVDVRRFNSVVQVEQGIDRELGTGTYRKLVKAGVKFAHKQDIPTRLWPPDGGIFYGVYDPGPGNKPGTGTAYVNIDDTPAARVAQVALHEVGVHAGFEAMVGSPKFLGVKLRMRSLQKSGSAEVTRAYAQAAAAGTSDKMMDEEALAYFIEERGNKDLPLYKQVLSWVKAWVARLTGIGISKLDEDTVATMIVMSLRRHKKEFLNPGGPPPPKSGRGAVLSRAEKAGLVAAAERDRNFKRWFGDSKVVDESGKPLVVYHGTKSDFSVFETGRSVGLGGRAELGFYFTPVEWVAESISHNIDGGGRSRVIPAFLSLQNPIEIDMNGRDGSVFRQIIKAKNDGYDGAIIKNWNDGTYPDDGGQIPNQYVAFRPTQIKSAIGNRGTFDPENPSILHSLPAARKLAEDAQDQAQYMERAAKRKGYDSVEEMFSASPMEFVELAQKWREDNPATALYSRPITEAIRARAEAINPDLATARGATPWAPETSLSPAAALLRQPPPDPDVIDGLRLQKVNGPQELKDFLRVAAKHWAPRIAEARKLGTTWEEQGEMAKKYAAATGRSLEQLKRAIPTGGQLSSKIRLGMETLVYSAQVGEALYAKAEDTGKAEDILAAQLHAARHLMIMETFAGGRSEAGRTLNILKQQVNAAKRVPAEVEKILQNYGGRDRLLQIGAMMRRLNAVNPYAGSAALGKAAMPSRWDKFMEVWINGLLSGPTTHAVNVTSNLLTQSIGLLELSVAAAIGKLHGGERVTFREVAARAAGMLRGVSEGAILGAHAYLTEQDVSGSKLEGRREAIEGKAGRLIRTPGRLLMGEDAFFQAIATRSAMNGLAYRDGIKQGLKGAALEKHVADLARTPPDWLIEGARKEADYYTFTNELGEKGRALQSFITRVPALRLVMPFIRTPINIVKFAAGRLAPLAPILGRELVADIKGDNGKAARDMALARLAVGSALAAWAVSAVAAGLLTGGPPDDERKRKVWYQENQPYSAKVGDTWYSYGRLEPLAMVVGWAADFAEIAKAVESGEADNLASMIGAAFARNLTSKTFLRGITDMIAAVADPERHGEKWALGLAGTVVPTGVAQVARAWDPTLREPRVFGGEAGAAQSLWEEAKNVARSRLPGLSEGLPARYDVWGKPIVREGALGPDLLSPFAQKSAKGDPLTRLLLDNQVYPSIPTRVVNGHKITAGEYARLSELVGQARRNAVERVSGRLEGLDHERSQLALKKALLAGLETGRALFIREHPAYRRKFVEAG